MEKYKIIRPGDLVVNRMNVIIGSVGRSAHHRCSSIEYYVLRGRNPEVDTRFYSQMFCSKAFQRTLVGIGTGILAQRMRIPYEGLKKVLVPVPPPSEQRQIADALEGEDRMLPIERLINRQMDLLREYRRALISAAVTGQLDLLKGAA